MKIAIQTTSTKCQYSAAMSTASASLGPEAALVVDRQQRAEPDDAGGDVRAVEAGEREQRRAEEVRPDGQPFMHERREFVRLEAEEGGAQYARDPQPELGRREQARTEAGVHGGSALPLFCTAARASTMASDDISSTNVDADVTGMSRIGGNTCRVCGSVHGVDGNGPTMLRPL